MAKDNGAKAEKPKKRSRVKETFAELKKVTWPTFGKTVKQTGAVFVVTIFFLVILLVLDYVLGLAHRALVSNLPDTNTTGAVVSSLVGSFKTVTHSLFGAARTLPLLI